MTATIEESLRKHHAAGPDRYNPLTLEPLSEDEIQFAQALHSELADLIGRGFLEVAGERAGKLAYRVTDLGNAALSDGSWSLEADPIPQ